MARLVCGCATNVLLITRRRTISVYSCLLLLLLLLLLEKPPLLAATCKYVGSSVFSPKVAELL